MLHMEVCLKLLKVGLNDCFSKGYGLVRNVRRMNHLSADCIVEKIMQEYMCDD
jgi:hypothetical protein